MTIHDLLVSLDHSYPLKLARVKNMRKFYLARYRSNMIELYDKGYISNPGLLDEVEIRKNTLDLGISLLTASGIVELSSNRIKAAYYTEEHTNRDSDILWFLNKLYWTYYYREQGMAIDKLFNDSTMHREGKGKLKLFFKRRGSLVYPNGVDYLCESVLECTMLDTSQVEKRSFGAEIYDLARRVLNIPGKTFTAHLTEEEEAEIVVSLLEEHIALDGEGGPALQEWLAKNNLGFSSDGSESFFDWLNINYSDEISTIQKHLLDSLRLDDEQIIAMDGDSFYIVRPRKTLELYYGIYAFDHETGELLPERNLLDGMTGEFIRVDSNVFKDHYYIGCPIDLYNHDLDKDLYVDIEQVVDLKGKPLFSEYSFNFDGGGDSNPWSLERIEGQIFDGYMGSKYGYVYKEVPGYRSFDEMERLKNKVNNKIFYL